MQAPTLAEARDHAERRAIEQALARHRSRLSAAAQELGVSRATLYRLMLAHGLRGRQEEAGLQRGRPEEAALQRGQHEAVSARSRRDEMPARGGNEDMSVRDGQEAAIHAGSGADFPAPPSAGGLAAAASAKRRAPGRARPALALQVASSDAVATVTL
jgi:hypothetical protein